MPCTSPFGRSEDALFGALATLCRSDAVMLETPFSVGHVQEAGRERQEALQRPETPDINLCLAELARHIGGDVHARDPALRLRAYAGRLRDLSAADDVGVGNYLREYLTYLRTTVVQTLQQALATTREPPLYWAADLRSLVERNGRAILERGVPRFAGWPADLDETGCVQRFRFEADALADGLERWPHAFEAAQTLHAKLLASI